MLIIGHRGAKGLSPENTLSSFQLAQTFNVSMIETDLRLSTSGEIVLSHRRLQASDRPVTLRQLLQGFKIPLNLELKESGFEAQLIQELKSFSPEVLISSKYPAILKKVRALDEKIKLGLILGRGNFFLLPFLSRLDQQIHLYSVHPKKFLANRRLIQTLKSLGKKVFVWVVNNPNKFQALKNTGIDGVFTDRPDIIHN